MTNDPTPNDLLDMLVGEDDNLVACEGCDDGVSYSTGEVCVACNGLGWREP